MERLVCDPPELIENRAELSLSGLGLEVREAGADWGEAQLEVQLARQQIGESVTNRHLNDVEVTIPLRVQAESGVNLAEASYKLQQKVALWQQEGGWIRRDFDVGGKFAGSVGYQVKYANLSGLQGWMMAHRQSAPEVTLKLVRSPLAYATSELESATFSGEARELVWTLENLAGSSPGLIRRRIKNENASADWRGLIAAMECRDYPTSGAETTAKLAYEAKALTKKGGSTEAERESLKVVRNTSLTAGWLSVLDTEISGVGHMTHAGVRRPFVRVYSEGTKVGEVELKFLWRPLGTLAWSENEIASLPVVNGWCLIDLGEVRCEAPTVGEARWEGQIQARALGGSGKVDIHRFWPLPTEQFAVYAAPGSTLQPELQSSKAPGTVADATGIGTQTWSNPENAKASDNSYATVQIEPGKASHFLKATNFGFAIPESATVIGITVSVERQNFVETSEGNVMVDNAVRIVKGGTIGSTDRSSALGWSQNTDEIHTYGASSDLWGEVWTAANINASTFGAAVSARMVHGLSTAKIDQIKISVFYSEEIDDRRVCFSTRAIELRTDGAFRQHKTASVFGRVLPEDGGFNFVSPVSGLEGRKARGIVIASQGDLGELADPGTNKMSEIVNRRPGYLFARESA